MKNIFKIIFWAAFTIAVFSMLRHYVALRTSDFTCGLVTEASRVEGDFWSCTYVYKVNGVCHFGYVNNRMDDEPFVYAVDQRILVKYGRNDPSQSIIAGLKYVDVCDGLDLCK